MGLILRGEAAFHVLGDPGGEACAFVNRRPGLRGGAGDRAARPLLRAVPVLGRDARAPAGGFAPSFVRYASNRQPVAASVREIGAFLDRMHLPPRPGEGGGPVHFVGYSLGALALRSALAARPDFPAGRFVMIAPPNRGVELLSGPLPAVAIRCGGPALKDLREDSDFVRNLPPPPPRRRDHRGRSPGYRAAPFLVAPPAARTRRPPRRYRRAAEHAPSGRPARNGAPLARHNLLEPQGRRPRPELPRIRPVPARGRLSSRPGSTRRTDVAARKDSTEKDKRGPAVHASLWSPSRSCK